MKAEMKGRGSVFGKIGDALRRFMYGRYGSDQLNLVLMGLAFVLLLIGIWVPVIRFLAIAVMVVYIFRCYSRNLTKRRQENAWFMRVIAPLRDRQHRYFRCPGCRQVVRVPRGKGRIKIGCPKCGRKFVKNA